MDPRGQRREPPLGASRATHDRLVQLEYRADLNQLTEVVQIVDLVGVAEDDRRCRDTGADEPFYLV